MNFSKPKFWNNQFSLLSLVLYPFSLFYMLLFNLKRILSKKINFSKPVICIGNIYLGGSGKTPLAISIAKMLLQSNFNPAIIRKKYESQFDEVDMIKEHFGKIFEHKKRKLAIEAAITKGHDFLVMDDGMQDFSIKTNLNIACFNTEQLEGNGFVLPAGPLREKLNGLKRCKIAVLNGEKNEEFERKLKKESHSIKIFYSKYSLENFDHLKNKKILCFAGIGNPSNFFKILEENEIKVIKKISFPDHYNYKKKDLDFINELAKKLDLEVITTEKDYFRLKKIGYENIKFVRVNLIIEKEKELLEHIIKNK